MSFLPEWSRPRAIGPPARFPPIHREPGCAPGVRRALKQSWEDEADPLAALGSGDPGPFEAFVRSEIPVFLGFYQRLGARADEAEDLCQDLFLKLYEHAPTYRPRGRFTAYAFRVARNLWIDRGRREGRRPRLTPLANPAAGRSGESSPNVEPADSRALQPDAELHGQEQRQRLMEALGRLSDEHRAVFELGVVQELPYQDIAEVMDVPLGTVKSRMFHAIRKLRAQLDDANTPHAVNIEEEGSPS